MNLIFNAVTFGAILSDYEPVCANEIGWVGSIA